MGVQDNDMNSEGFGLPEGYFGSTARKLADKLAWAEEHRAFPFLAAVSRKAGFVVPPGYFENEPFENAPYPVLAGLRSTRPFDVPENYFDASEEKLTAMGTGSFYPALHAAGKMNAFLVPEGYFENSRGLLAEVCRPQARIFRIGIWLQAAAVLLLTLGLFTYRHYQQQEDAAADCRGIACLDRHELLEAKSLEDATPEELYDLVNPETLRESLEEKEGKDSGTDSSDMDTEAYLYDI